MKRLLLLRHAKAVHDPSIADDRDRPLSARGRHDAPAMGRRIAARDAAVDRIVSSPARRALETAGLVARELGSSPDQIREAPDLYEADTADLLRVIHGWDDAAGSVLLVGHNPGLLSLADRLSGGQVNQMPPGAVACLRFDVPTWKQVGPAAGVLEFFESPKEPGER